MKRSFEVVQRTRVRLTFGINTTNKHRFGQSDRLGLNRVICLCVWSKCAAHTGCRPALLNYEAGSSLLGLTRIGIYAVSNRFFSPAGGIIDLKRSVSDTPRQNPAAKYSPREMLIY